MAQSRLFSALESLTSTAIGFGVAVAANYLILPLFGYNVTFLDSTSIGIIFTLISLVRGYWVRRLFNLIKE